MQWHITQLGAGIVRHNQSDLRLTIPPTTRARYHDAQVSDYTPQTLNFRHVPPLKLTLTARAEGDIQGTAGFGFWNHLYVPGQWRFRIPQVVWFFFGHCLVAVPSVSTCSSTLIFYNLLIMRYLNKILTF